MTRPLANITLEALEPVWTRQDIPTEVIAAKLGVTRQGLSYKARSLGLFGGWPKTITIAEFYEQELAERLKREAAKVRVVK